MEVSVFSPLGVENGEVKVWTSAPGKPHTLDFWAARAMERIMSVADSAPQPIRDQAYAFRAQIEAEIKVALVSAVRDRRAYDILKIEPISHEAAVALREG